MRIAAFVDIEGNTQSFNTSGIVQIYEKVGNTQWDCVGEVPFYIKEGMNLAEIRKNIYAMASQLGNCRILIARRCMGIFNAIFDEELHIRIFLLEGSPIRFLDQVWERVRLDAIEAIKIAEQRKQTEDNIEPVMTQIEGCYKINLVKVQEDHASMNSKDILLPFFEKKKFVELEIICLHTPKWIERKLIDFNYTVKTEIRKDGFCHTFVYQGK